MICDCEHASHFDEANEDVHPYGKDVRKPCKTIYTIYGKFDICDDCERQHPLPKELMEDKPNSSTEG